MEFKSQTSLKSVIRRQISNRIFAAFALLVILIGSLISSELRVSATQFTKDLAESCKALEDFAIGQILTDNEQAISSKVDQFNNEHPDLRLNWVKDKNDTLSPDLSWKLPLSWNYIYPLRAVGNKNFGEFEISGSFLTDKFFLKELLVRISLLAIFFVLIFVCLFPLWNKIPEELFFKPIRDLLDTIKDQKNTSQSKSETKESRPEEIQTLRDKIFELISKEKDALKVQEGNKIRAQLAHDLKSPLEVIGALGQENDSDETSKKVKFLAILRMKKMVQDLLVSDTQEKQTDSPSEILVADALNNIFTEKKIQYETSATKLTLEIPEIIESKFICVNPINFQRALSNLIDNAFQAIDKPNGEITLTIESTTSTDFEISITDNGKGMTQEKLESLGSENTPSDKKGGHGLGISQAIGAMKEAGAKVSFTSQVGIGTKVMVTIPEAQPPLWFAELIQFKKGSTFVILDDDPSVHTLWKDYLKEESCESLFAYNKDQFNGLTADPNNFFLVDYQFDHGSMSGIDVIKTHGLERRSILATSLFSDPAIQNSAIENGIKIVPKHLIKTTPVQAVEELEKDKTPDAILIDDDFLVRSTWGLHSNRIKINLLSFTDDETFSKIKVPTETPIFIDYNLKEKNGFDVAINLSRQGFSKLHIVTGHPKEHFKNIPDIITSVRGKQFPFDLFT